ncbi:MAG: protoporphyrinogen oxidase [bacterium]
MQRVAVVGGGITGLTTALKVRDLTRGEGRETEVLVLEASDRLGGNIRTSREEGFTMEWGPNGYLDNAPETSALVGRLGLEGQIQKADESAAKRYLYRDGQLHLLPTGPLSFLTSPVLSLPGRLRVFLEPFARGRPEDEDETIYAFASRRIGSEAARILIDAMVSGVYAGDIHELSLKSTFPKMYAMESEHGGLVRALLARMKERRAAKKRVAALEARGDQAEELVRPGGPAGPGGTLTSFKDGLDTWIEALASELERSWRLSSPVTAIREEGDLSGGRYTIEIGGRRTLHADAVVLTMPAPKAAPSLRSLDGDLAAEIDALPTAGLAVVALGYDEADLDGAPAGFGFLVPRDQGIRILGCLWDSSIFPGRAPGGKVLLRVMIGGAHDPGAVTLPEEELLETVRRELGETMGIDAEPLLSRVFRHPLGIGQYPVGHQERMDRIHRHLGRHPGLFIAGSSYYGVSMNACIEKASEQAPEIVTAL